MSDDSELIYPNGVSLTEGPLRPIEVGALETFVRRRGLGHIENNERSALEKKTTKIQSGDDKEAFLRVKEGVDARKLTEAGWGLVFAGKTLDRDIREALRPLLELREQQAGKLYKELHCPRGKSVREFLRHYDAGFGTVDPEFVPYYLLIVASPEDLSFRFQCQLDVQYAVGRLWLETPQEYANYVRGVLAAEQRARELVFFGPNRENDEATSRSAKHLLDPLAQWFEDDQPDQRTREHGGWTTTRKIGPDATRSQLIELLGGEDTPALMFSATHGITVPKGHADQRRVQGALVTQEWEADGAPDREHYLCAEDIGDDAHVQGMIAFMFGCYTAATPQHSDHDLNDLEAERAPEIAEHPFVAALPARLLGHPNGGALAVVGHIDKAWTTSFILRRRGDEVIGQRQVFESALKCLAEDGPIGLAMEYFNERYATITTELALALNEKITHETVKMWLESSDMRDYIVLGDPAVRLSLEPPGGGAQAQAEAASATPSHASKIAVHTLRTYVCEDLSALSLWQPDAPPPGATLRLVTQIRDDGVVDSLSPRDPAPGDEAARQLHVATLAAFAARDQT